MTAINEVVDLAAEGTVAVITVNSPPVNALSANVRTGIAEAVQKAGADAAVKAIVIHCAGRQFKCYVCSFSKVRRTVFVMLRISAHP